jgi:hypothetical protein
MKLATGLTLTHVHGPLPMSLTVQSRSRSFVPTVGRILRQARARLRLSLRLHAPTGRALAGALVARA